MGEFGRVPSGQATRASHGAGSRLHHSAGILRALIERCERTTGADEALDFDIWEAVGKPAEYLVRDLKLDPPDYTASVDAALTLLPEGADWRRLTDRSASTYAANPYNPQAQKRLDGFGKTVPLQLCSAALKVRLEAILKAIATEARRAGTGNTDPVHEGAGREAALPKTHRQDTPSPPEDM